MSDEEFEDEPEPEPEPELDLDEDLVEDILDDDDDVLDVVVDDLVTEIPVPVVTDETATETLDEEEDEGVVDLDEELHPDDVEEPLDVLLQERTASATLEDDEEEVEDDEVDVDERGDGSTRIAPRGADEFLCKSCFLVLPLRRLADKERQFCDDCA